MKRLRWIYIAGLIAFPWVVWWGVKVFGAPVPTWRLPGRPHPVGLFVVWAIVWELMALAPLLELRGPIESWRQEITLWVLYALFGATMSGLFAGWIWGTLLIREAIVRRFPFLVGWEEVIQPFIAIGLAAAFFFIVGWFVKHDLHTAFRTFLRYRLLRLSTSNEELMALLDTVPLSPDTKAYFRARLQGEVSPTVLWELLAAVETLPIPQTPQEKSARLRLEQILRNRLDEEAFRRWN